MLPEISTKIAIDNSINTVAVIESTIYLNELSRANLSLYVDISTKEATATISMNTYNEKISDTITMPFIPANASKIRFRKLNLLVSSE